MQGFLIAIFCFSTSCIFAQTILVVDKKNTPIENARFLFKNIDDSILNIDTSNKAGIVSITKFKEDLNISIAHISFLDTLITIKKEYLKLNHKIVLRENIELLDEVLLNSKSSVIKKGDTTTVRISNYANGTERSLIDLLNKIPGVRVDQNNTVFFNDKVVTSAMVNGIPLFNMDYKSSIDEINPDKILEIQFIENHIDNTAFTDDRKKNIAMNLGFKDQVALTGALRAGQGLNAVKEASANVLVPLQKVAGFMIHEYDNLGYNDARNSLNNSESHWFNQENLRLFNLRLPYKVKAGVSNSTYNSTIKIGTITEDGVEYTASNRNDVSAISRSDSSNEILNPGTENQIQRSYLENHKIEYTSHDFSLLVKKKNKNNFLSSLLRYHSLDYDWINRNQLNINTPFFRTALQLI